MPVQEHEITRLQQVTLWTYTLIIEERREGVLRSRRQVYHVIAHSLEEAEALLPLGWSLFNIINLQ